MEPKSPRRPRQGNTEASGGEPQPGAEETGHVKEDEGKREKSGERTLRHPEAGKQEERKKEPQDEAQTEVARQRREKKHL